ncbi:response regulator [Maribacter algicola]|uniref:histidine kinase n=1 Tax=Maribacter algicola TaxID=2498892 RepID=A0A3R8R3U0_9FLAO|nr:ATP-binding protein [Maribacter algicola]RRQ49416.1 response regulator [Maribacter algicola]
MRFFYHILLLLCLKSGFVLSQESVYVLDTLYPVHSLDHMLQVYKDSDNSLTPEKIKSDSTLTYLRGDELPKYLEVGTTYWGKLALRAKQPMKGWTLHFEDKMIGPPAWTKSNGTVDVFGYIDGKMVFQEKTGVEYPKNERGYKGYWVMNAIKLDRLPIDKAITLIMKVEGNSFGYPSYFNLTVRSPEQPYYYQFNQFNNSFNLFLFGVTFIILVYHLLQYFYLRESIYLWFCFWLLFCTFTQAMTTGLFIGSIITFRYAIWFLIANGQFYSWWFFGRAFVDSKRKFLRTDKMMLGLALLILTEILLTAFYVVFTKPQTNFTGVGFHYVILNIYTVLSLVVSIVLILKKDLFARYFGIGTLVACLSMIVGTLWSLGIITPPFRLDPYATGIFLQIIIYSFGIAYRRQTLSKQSEYERLEAERSRTEMLRMKDLDDLKTRFFTNISHEFRTPLTLIQGPISNAKRLKENTDDDGVTLSHKDFDMVQRNAGRLNSLVNELLELAKLESGKTLLSVKQADIVPFLKLMVYSFESMAERAQLSYDVVFKKMSKMAYFDSDKLEKMVSNVLSNAFKYTEKGGKVSVVVDFENDKLLMSVSDTGNGIAQEDLPYVFDRFYRVEGSEKKGSGIGLALTKELVDLHQGEIKVESVLGEGTTFLLTLPITLVGLPKSALVIDQEATKVSINNNSGILFSETEINDSTTQLDMPIVLVVEDNADLRSYISDILAGEYVVLVAEDGEQGERMALEQIPDIVISDVMMPKKDGFALCEALKTNSKTSHIPVILLTAKAGQDNKMQGLYQGADAYVTKPFSAEELLVRSKNLISLREKLWQKIKDADGILLDDLPLNSMDDEFMQKVFRTIKDHLDNSSFSVELLANSVGFSRAQLHRKLKALVNKSPNQLISEVRLKTAYQLLMNKTGNVSEVAYSVGFSNLSYFAKSFKDKFGVSPSELTVTKS